MLDEERRKKIELIEKRLQAAEMLKAKKSGWGGGDAVKTARNLPSAQFSVNGSGGFVEGAKFGGELGAGRPTTMGMS